jgi:hypothetical protein
MINKDRKIEGLRERIASAKSPEDVTKLLDEGATYTQASERTRNDKATVRHRPGGAR